jgi:hypothetical protein
VKLQAGIVSEKIMAADEHNRKGYQFPVLSHTSCKHCVPGRKQNGYYVTSVKQEIGGWSLDVEVNLMAKLSNLF